MSPEKIFPNEVRATMWRAESRQVYACQGKTSQRHFLAISETSTDGSRKGTASAVLTLPLDFQTRDSRLIAQLRRPTLVDRELHPEVPGSRQTLRAGGVGLKNVVDDVAVLLDEIHDGVGCFG